MAADTETIETVETTRFRIVDVSPVPTGDVLAAITVALDEAWPKPSSAAPVIFDRGTEWRFGERRWRDRQIPRRTWGRSR